MIRYVCGGAAARGACPGVAVHPARAVAPTSCGRRAPLIRIRRTGRSGRRSSPSINCCGPGPPTMRRAAGRVPAPHHHHTGGRGPWPGFCSTAAPAPPPTSTSPVGSRCGQRAGRFHPGPGTGHRAPAGLPDRGPGRTVGQLPGLREFLPTEIALALGVAETTRPASWTRRRGVHHSAARDVRRTACRPGSASARRGPCSRARRRAGRGSRALVERGRAARPAGEHHAPGARPGRGRSHPPRSARRAGPGTSRPGNVAASPAGTCPTAWPR